MAAVLPDIMSLIQAGIDPKTGLPIKAGVCDGELKNNIKKLLRIKDEQDAINRYKWTNLPNGLDEILERVLFYKGQGMLFHMKTNDTYYFLPFALDGTIDCYGRYLGVTPIPFGGNTGDGKKERPWITGLIKKPVYDMDALEKVDDAEDYCVILTDYSRQISQTVLPRQMLNEPLLDVMANCIPFMNTALQNQTGTLGMRVNSQDEYSNVLAANRSVKHAALEGDKYVPVVGNVDFQEMTGENVGLPADFMQAMESLDNFRLSLYGLENGGVFQKKEHMLGQEQDMANSTNELVYEDGLTIRKRFCELVNNLWGLNISCNEVESDSEMNDELTNNYNEESYNEGGQDE